MKNEITSTLESGGCLMGTEGITTQPGMVELCVEVSFRLIGLAWFCTMNDAITQFATSA